MIKFLTVGILSLHLILLLVHQGHSNPNYGLAQQNRNNRVMCTHNSLMIYFDCRICVCPKSNRPARCFRKTCDLRTKDGGQCPATYLRMDDDQLCPKDRITTCTTDNDCPGNKLCCFDFCRGTQCLDPTPLEFGMNKHQGRGYP